MSKSEFSEHLIYRLQIYQRRSEDRDGSFSRDGGIFPSFRAVLNVWMGGDGCQLRSQSSVLPVNSLVLVTYLLITLLSSVSVVSVIYVVCCSFVNMGTLRYSEKHCRVFSSSSKRRVVHKDYEKSYVFLCSFARIKVF